MTGKQGRKRSNNRTGSNWESRQLRHHRQHGYTDTACCAGTALYVGVRIGLLIRRCDSIEMRSMVSLHIHLMMLVFRRSTLMMRLHRAFHSRRFCKHMLHLRRTRRLRYRSKALHWQSQREQPQHRNLEKSVHDESLARLVCRVAAMNKLRMRGKAVTSGKTRLPIQR